MSVNFGLLLLGSAAPSLLWASVLSLIGFSEGISETLIGGLGRSRLRWLRRLLRFVPKLSAFDLFLYGFGLHFLAVVAVVGGLVIVAVIVSTCLLLDLCVFGSLLFSLLLGELLFLFNLCFFRLFRSFSFILLFGDVLDFFDTILFSFLLLIFFFFLGLLDLLLLNDFLSLLLEVSLVARGSTVLTRSLGLSLGCLCFLLLGCGLGGFLRCGSLFLWGWWLSNWCWLWWGDDFLL